MVSDTISKGQKEETRWCLVTQDLQDDSLQWEIHKRHGIPKSLAADSISQAKLAIWLLKQVLSNVLCLRDPGTQGYAGRCKKL